MKNLRLVFCALGLFGVAMSAIGISPAKVTAESTSSSKPLAVCRDVDGNTKTGELDVLLLLDNSKSLNSTRNNRTPSDRNNDRYKAIGEMLKSLGEVSGKDDDRKGVLINFGVVAFGDKANTAIALQSLTSSNSQEISARVQEKVPPKVESQSSSTNYIRALDAAVKVLSERPDENCKFLVWFTDGQFEAQETNESADQIEQAGMLKRSVCKSGGFADQFKKSRINTFVLILKPTQFDKRRLGVSYGAMEAITGATDLPPEVKTGIGSSKDMCGNLSTSPHLGEVLIASDAKEIARKIPTIANLLTKWVEITDCPAGPDGGGLSSMPAARHIERLSFTAYEKGRELVQLKDSQIIDNSGKSHPFSDFFVEDSGSRFEQKYRMKSEAEQLLDQGWSIDIKDGQSGWCVQMLAHNFEVAFQGTPSSVVMTSKGGQLTTGDLNNLAYFEKNNEKNSFSLSEASSFTGEIAASLVIDPTQKIYDGPLPVGVMQQFTPYLSCDSFTLKQETNIPNPARISAACEINTVNTRLNDVTISILSDDVLKNSECDAVLGLTEVKIDESLGKNYDIAPELVHSKGASKLYVTLEAKGKSAKCTSNKSKVIFKFEGEDGKIQSLEREIKVDIEWKMRPPMWIVWAIVALALLIVALLNLLLLREIKKRTSRMSSGLFAFEVPVKLTRLKTGQITVTTSEGNPLSSVAFNIDEQFAVRVEDDRRHAKFVGGSRSALHVKLPSLFRPFTAPVLVLDSKKPVYYAPGIENGSGLSPLVRQAVIVHSPISDGESCNATASLLIPNTGFGRDQIIRDLLGSKLTNALKPVANDKEWFTSSNTQPIRETASADAPSDSVAPKPDNGGLQPPRPGSR